MKQKIFENMMRIKKHKKFGLINLLIITIVSLTLYSAAFAQNAADSNPAGAREVMLKFIDLNNRQLLQSEEARRLLTGSAAEWKESSFGQIYDRPAKIVANGKNHAVAGVLTDGKNSRIVDLYFYLRYEDGWKISSLRAMAQTGWLETIREGLAAKSALTAEEKESLANAELTLSSDKSLTEWFQKNRLACDQLAALGLLETKKPKPKPLPKPKPRVVYVNGIKTVAIAATAVASPEEIEEREMSTVESVTGSSTKFPRSAAALKKLHFSALELKGSGNLEIVIGGITDNTVGYIYSPSGKPPQIDGWRYIWVEKIAAGWYLFRTT